MNASNEREFERLSLAMPGRLKNEAGQKGFVAVVDLSPKGCRVAPLDANFGAGQMVTFYLDQLHGLNARVRWRNGHAAGIEFEFSLYLPVVEHLQRNWPMPDLAGAERLVVGQSTVKDPECPTHFMQIITKAKAIDEAARKDALARLTHSKLMGFRLRYC